MPPEVSLVGYKLLTWTATEQSRFLVAHSVTAFPFKFVFNPQPCNLVPVSSSSFIFFLIKKERKSVQWGLGGLKSIFLISSIVSHFGDPIIWITLFPSFFFIDNTNKIPLVNKFSRF